MKISSKGNSVSLEVLFWWDASDKAIHVATNDPDAPTFHIAVRPDKSKPSGHPYLFRELTKCLRQAGAPAPDDPPPSN